jgi:PKHD-type hydroxylase
MSKRYQYCVTPGVFTPEEIEAIGGLAGDLEPGLGDHTGAERRSRVSLLSADDPANEWIFERLNGILAEHNLRFYGYDIDYIQPLQYSEYSAEDGGCYEWHQDWGAAVHNGRPEYCRKMSFTLQLSLPSDYEGGRLEINYGQDYAKESEEYLEQGTLVSFPSFMLHRVSPVTRGVRRSLVGWCMGPDYK